MSVTNPYNEYGKIRQFEYNIVTYLMQNNQEVWKLLNKALPNCLSDADLTIEQKGALIYQGQPDSTPYRVFLQPFTDDAFDEQQSQIRIYTSYIKPTNRVYGLVDFCFEVVSHNKICTLDGYENRNVVLMQQIIETLNGSDINGVGLLTFDYSRSTNNRANIALFNKNFQGYRFCMSLFTA